MSQIAKKYKNASLICTVLSIIAFLGIVIGVSKSNPLITIIFLLPTVVYEVYRTGGVSTKLSSILLLIVYIAELFLIIGNVNYDLATFFGAEKKIIAGYAVPLGDVKIVGPALMAILSIILFVRTRGRYTKWLAAIIFITSFVIAYTIDPANFAQLLRFGADSVLDQI